MRFVTPSPAVSIRSWKKPELTVWKTHTKSAKDQGVRAVRSAAFEGHLHEARRILGTVDPLPSARLEHRGVRRAIVTVWAEDAAVAEATLRIDLLDLVVPPDATRSTLVTLQLARVYYSHFDHLDTWEEGLFAHVGSRLADLTGRSGSRRANGVFTALTNHRGVSLGGKAPARIAEHVITAEEALPSYLERIGLGDYGSGRFIELVQQHTYVKQLERADPSDPPEFLRELTDPRIFKAPTGDRRRLGHLIVEAMTHRASSTPHSSWLNTILDIAGDPRARGTTPWNTWWAQISDDSRTVMTAWLTTQDLTLFLAAVERLGEREDDPELQRMFPARKKLLEGLHRLGLIRETRLLAGNQTRIMLRRDLAGDLRTEITSVKGAHANFSVIYLDCGDFHIVEGSHSFKLHVFAGGPPQTFAEWSTSTVHIAELRTPTVGRDTVYDAYTHDVKLRWIALFLLFLAEHDIYVKPQEVMDPETYETVKSRYALPSRRRR